MKFKITCALLLAFLILISADAKAERGPVGAGIILGEPVGLSFKYWTASTQAIDLAVAWKSSKDDNFHIHADYLLHNFTVLKPDKGKLPIYYGLGGRFKYWEKPKNKDDEKQSAGIRFPVGMAYIFDNAPLDIFLEVVPVMDILPDTSFDLCLALGIRYFF